MSELPAPSGRVLAVCLGPGGIPKHAVASARVTKLGLVGDGHRFRGHGGEHRAVCLLSREEARALEKDGVAFTGPGMYGENLLVEGLDLAALVPGDRLAVGDEVVLEVDDVREPCATLRPIDARFPALMLGRSGLLCRVIREGVVRPGQAIARLA